VLGGGPSGRVELAVEACRTRILCTALVKLVVTQRSTTAAGAREDELELAANGSGTRGAVGPGVLVGGERAVARPLAGARPAAEAKPAARTGMSGHSFKKNRVTYQ
jgi:hypothetical protein